MNIFFFITTFPICIIGIIFNFFNMLIPEVIFYSLYYLQYVYCTFDIFVYIIINRAFREYCLKLINIHKYFLIKNIKLVRRYCMKI
jgi:hypothetical protein